MDTLRTILEAVLIGGLQLSHRKCLEVLIRALLLTMSINLVKLARATFTDAKTLSTVRRIERLLAMKLFPVAIVGKAIVKALPPQKKFILTMDRQRVWQRQFHKMAWAKVYSLLPEAQGELLCA